MSELVEFEKWFCGLNADFPMDQLSRIHGRYFYTMTQTLYELYVENKKLRDALSQIYNPDKVMGYYNCRRLARIALEKADE